MSRKHLLYLLVTGLVLLIAPFFIFLWTGIAETGIISMVGIFLCLGTSDALWGTKGMLMVGGVFIAMLLLYFGSLLLQVPSIYPPTNVLGLAYLFIGFVIIIIVAVIATKTIYQKKLPPSSENKDFSHR